LEIRLIESGRPKLIYCAGGNRRFAQIAIDGGYLYGARLPRDKPHFPIYFADHNWKEPDREQYMRQIQKHKPTMATVLDLEYSGQLSEVLSWAEEASQYCEMVIIVPKVIGSIRRIPKQINGKTIVLGFSVPTQYGSTPVPEMEFKNRHVHLLGGSPHKQMGLWRKMRHYCNVLSVDGNYVQKMAVRYNRFWTNGDALYARNRWFPRLDEAEGVKWTGDAPYEAFRRSCVNIKSAWEVLCQNKE
jgi:hypothetical protein